MKTLLKLCFILTLIFSIINTVNAQNKKADKTNEIKQLVNSQKYIFKAAYMYPSYGGQKYLSTDYDLYVGRDTVKAYLPYYGVAYFGVGYNTDDNGIKFTSTDFDYTVKDKKKGSWYIVIKPKDIHNTNQLILNISPNGYADLTVISNNRQRIRFDGNIIAKN
ncbi:DUF4251 domain-containing protein [Mucilaginibacter segetis]|uniref:DUF4251 domain-containing protein n=1 Tax=Mucilaginibacter segetis TaxID=2793071 RepID=A0A934PT83_9SPHI|nr:DUF4251 domain-containing protein [Mucilaginibacter segetis]MBK0379107.1 DUF4251 domain-containing protein [Mucilaginibacter segetis]